MSDFLEMVHNGNNKLDGGLIEKAYRFAEEAHGSQTRESGEPYIVHPVEVAKICFIAISYDLINLKSKVKTLLYC